MFYYDLTLRKAHKNDLKNMLELKLEVHSNHHRVALLNETDQIKWFDSLDQDVYQPKNLVLIGIDLDIDVGVFFISNINYINGTCDVGYDIYKQHREKGFGTRLVKSGIDFCKNILNLRKLNLEILEHNMASIKVCLKNNFVYEGTKIKQIYKQGKYIDSLLYGLLLY